jgi:hypothetical protein
LNWRIPLTAAAALACVSFTGVATAKSLVVRSAGPSAKTYPPGKALPDNAKIMLQSGDSVTVLGAGSKRILRGPGSFPAAVGSTDLAMATSKRGRFGALRTGDLALNPSPWNLDVSQSGTMCIARGAGLKMWRPNAEEAAKLGVKGAASPTVIDWPAGKAMIEWPAGIEIADGSEFELTFAGKPTGERVRFSLIPSIPEDITAAASALIEHGCQNQLDLLVDGIDGRE